MTTHGGIGLVTQEGQTYGCHLCSDLVRATRVQPQCGLPETKVVHLDVSTHLATHIEQSSALGKYLEAGAIGAIVVLFAALGFIQEYRAEQAIAAEAERKRAEAELEGATFKPNTGRTPDKNGWKRLAASGELKKLVKQESPTSTWDAVLPAVTPTPSRELPTQSSATLSALCSWEPLDSAACASATPSPDT